LRIEHTNCTQLCSRTSSIARVWPSVYYDICNQRGQRRCRYHRRTICLHAIVYTMIYATNVVNAGADITVVQSVCMLYTVIPPRAGPESRRGSGFRHGKPPYGTPGWIRLMTIMESPPRPPRRPAARTDDGCHQLINVEFRQRLSQL